MLQFDQIEISLDELLKLSLLVGTSKWTVLVQLFTIFLLRYSIIIDFEKDMLSTNVSCLIITLIYYVATYLRLFLRFLYHTESKIWKKFLRVIFNWLKYVLLSQIINNIIFHLHISILIKTLVFSIRILNYSIKFFII